MTHFVEILTSRCCCKDIHTVLTLADHIKASIAKRSSNLIKMFKLLLLVALLVVLYGSMVTAWLGFGLFNHNTATVNGSNSQVTGTVGGAAVG